MKNYAGYPFCKDMLLSSDGKFTCLNRPPTANLVDKAADIIYPTARDMENLLKFLFAPSEEMACISFHDRIQ